MSVRLPPDEFHPPPITDSKAAKALELVLSGDTVEEACKKVGRGDFKSPLDRRKFLESSGIKERNELAFEAIEANYLRPYEVIEEAQNAMKYIQVVETDYDHESGKPFNVTTTREVPDWPVRLKAAQIKLQLLGLDPRLEPRIGIAINNGNTEIRATIGEMYMSVVTIQGDDSEAKIAALNEVRRAERENGARLLPSTKREVRMRQQEIDDFEKEFKAVRFQPETIEAEFKRDG